MTETRLGKGSTTTNTKAIARAGAEPPPGTEHLPCPRCHSTNTKFCYYNNYNSSQPRHFCKNCRRYWTQGGNLRDIPVGGGTRKNAKRSRTISATDTSAEASAVPSDPAQTRASNGPACVPFAGGHGQLGSFTSLLMNEGCVNGRFMGLGFGGFGLGVEGDGGFLGGLGSANGGGWNVHDTWQVGTGGEALGLSAECAAFSSQAGTWLLNR